MTKRINKRRATGNDVYLRPVRRIMDDSCLRFLRKEEVEEEEQGCGIDKRTEKKKVGDRERKRMREERGTKSMLSRDGQCRKISK